MAATGTLGYATDTQAKSYSMLIGTRTIGITVSGGDNYDGNRESRFPLVFKLVTVSVSRFASVFTRPCIPTEVEETMSKYGVKSKAKLDTAWCERRSNAGERLVDHPVDRGKDYVFGNVCP